MRETKRERQMFETKMRETKCERQTRYTDFYWLVGPMSSGFFGDSSGA